MPPRPISRSTRQTPTLLVDRELARPTASTRGERRAQQLRRERRRMQKRRWGRREAEQLFDLRPAGRIAGALRVQERRLASRPGAPSAPRTARRRAPSALARHRPPPGEPLAERLQQPRAGAHPVALYRPDGRIEGGSGLFLGQSRRNTGTRRRVQARVEPFERRERLVHGDDQLGLRIDAEVDLVEHEPVPVAGALLRAVMPRVIDQHAAHRPRADGEEMRAVLPVDAGLVRQLQVDFVHQRRGRERGRGPAARELAARDRGAGDRRRARGGRRTPGGRRRGAAGAAR